MNGSTPQYLADNYRLITTAGYRQLRLSTLLCARFQEIAQVLSDRSFTVALSYLGEQVTWFWTHLTGTSKATVVTSVRSASTHLPVHGTPWWVLLQHCIMLRRLFFNVECGIACLLCTMRVFEVQTSSSSLGYLCAKFCFFRGFHCWASPRRKITYSITQSRTQLIWCRGNGSAHGSEFPQLPKHIFLA